MKRPDIARILEAGPERLSLEVELHPDDPCFAGHFEGLPVLAGIVQVHWAVAFAEWHWQRRLVFKAMQSAKFQKLVRPPVRLQLTLHYQPGGGLLKYAYRDHRGVCARGGLSVEELERD